MALIRALIIGACPNAFHLVGADLLADEAARIPTEN